MRNNKSKVILSILFAVILCAVVLFPNITLAADTRPSYVALGDSIPAGYGLSTTADAYPALVGKEINYLVSNLAESGDTTSDLISKLKTATYKNKLSKASLVTISIGGNDLMGSLDNILTLLYGEAAVVDGIYAKSLANLRTICSLVLSSVPSNCIILFENIYNPYESMGSIGKTIGDRIQRQNQQIKTVCDERKGITFVDVTSMNGNPDNFNAGKGSTMMEIIDCHPTKAGHRGLADLIKAGFYNAGGKNYVQSETTTTAKIETTSVYTTEPPVYTSHYETVEVSTSIVQTYEVTSVTATETTELTTEITTTEAVTETDETTTTEEITTTNFVETSTEGAVSTTHESTTEEPVYISTEHHTDETTSSSETEVTASESVENTTENETTTLKETEKTGEKGKVKVWVVIVCLVGGAAVLVGAYFLMYNIFKYILMKRKD